MGWVAGEDMATEQRDLGALSMSTPRTDSKRVGCCVMEGQCIPFSFSAGSKFLVVEDRNVKQ